MNDSDPEFVKLYPVWSNFIYFIACIYAFFVAITFKSLSAKTLFLLYSLLIFCTGIFSIVYHLHTPSWTGKINTHKTPKFKKWLNVDVGFAVSLLLYSLLFLIIRIAMYRNRKGKFPIKQILYDPNFFLSVFFIILSIIFFSIAGNHYSEAHSCNNNQDQENNNHHHRMICFSKNLDAYDILHSNWHIFTSIAIIFWISLLYNSYTW